MRITLASKILTLSIVALGAAAISCGSVTSTSDGGTAGTSAGGTTGAAGTGSGTAGTSGAAGTSGGGIGGRGGAGGMAGLGGTGGAPPPCRTDVAGDCPTGFTCACGGPGPVSLANCTCHRNCTDTNQCPMAEPMCGCPGAPAGTARYCVNACFCSCN